jgi:2-methylisocitrate lyase-like PEP mutase family enzyme
MTKAGQLRALIEAPGLLVMPGAYDVISARIIEDAGFQAVQASGANLAACHYGVPDYSLISMREMVEQTGRIAMALQIPVMGDADTGFGNAVNAYYAVQAFEASGTAGINIEDQLIPKRCGHLDGKVVLPFDEAVAKIAAAAAARVDPDFVINARTDALAVHGIDDVIKRGNAFLEVGATMVFVEGAHSADVMRQAVAGIRGPVAVNLVEGGKSPQTMSFAELEEIGIARVSLPSTAMQASIRALREVFARVRADGAIGGYADLLAGFGVSQRLVGSGKVAELEEKYLAPLLGSSGGGH